MPLALWCTKKYRIWTFYILTNALQPAHRCERAHWIQCHFMTHVFVCVPNAQKCKDVNQALGDFHSTIQAAGLLQIPIFTYHSRHVQSAFRDSTAPSWGHCPRPVKHPANIHQIPGNPDSDAQKDPEFTGNITDHLCSSPARFRYHISYFWALWL